MHRDIFWVGRQWSVTGYGMQAIDQKLKGKFDIEASRLWDDDLLDALRDEKWFNAGDFDKGLSEAHKHYPPPAGKTVSKAAPDASGLASCLIDWEDEHAREHRGRHLP